MPAFISRVIAKKLAGVGHYVKLAGECGSERPAEARSFDGLNFAASFAPGGRVTFAQFSMEE